MAGERDVYDVCVIGAGIEGSSTARYLATRGKKTLLLEQFHLPHSRGSSHGSTRLVRHGYSTHVFSDLMPEAFEMWRDIENKAGKELIKKVGLLSVERPPFNELSKLTAIVRSLGVKCEVLSRDEIRKRFPCIKLGNHWNGTFEPEGGFIMASQALQAIQSQFVEFGGKLCDGEKVENIEPGSIVQIHTARNVYKAKSVIIAAGPWVNEVLKPLGIQLPVEIWRVLLSYWKPQDPKKYSVEGGFPGFIVYLSEHEHIYGFPVYEYPGLVKVSIGLPVHNILITFKENFQSICHHTGVEISSPESREEVRTNEMYVKKLSEFIKADFDGIDPVPKILEACIYTVTPDHSFFLDHHPLHHNIVIGAGFSENFHHATDTDSRWLPVVGKILSQLVLGEKPSYDMGPFKISRFKNVKSSL
ncbi:hypothetical protein QZH41_009958 [Actinostola sp. cb2023]|nr:hypothetical protein QZH41_009958 [Actinostola sp. cb2023]